MSVTQTYPIVAIIQAATHVDMTIKKRRPRVTLRSRPNHRRFVFKLTSAVTVAIALKLNHRVARMAPKKTWKNVTMKTIAAVTARGTPITGPIRIPLRDLFEIGLPFYVRMVMLLMFWANTYQFAVAPVR